MCVIVNNIIMHIATHAKCNPLHITTNLNYCRLLNIFGEFQFNRTNPLQEAGNTETKFPACPNPFILSYSCKCLCLAFISCILPLTLSITNRMFKVSCLQRVHILKCLALALCYRTTFNCCRMQIAQCLFN